MDLENQSKFKKFLTMPFSRQLVLVVGIFCIIWGLFFLYLAFNKEDLSNGGKISEVTEYIADKPKLSIGEVKVTKTTRYLEDAEYELIYKNYMKKDKDIEVLDKSSGIQIVDFLGVGYNFIDNSIVVNGSNYNSKKDIKISISGGTIRINIPHNKCNQTNTIKLKIKLVQNARGTKYYTSRDSYYNFVPSSDNKFYGKKTPQSYLIDGNGYIKLSN